MKVLAQARGLAIPTDYPLPGHPAEAPTSLELLLASLATCVANGVAFMLRREGHTFDGLEVQATGRRRDAHPTVLESIHLELEVRGGGLEGSVVAQAIRAAEAICPVWAMLRPGTTITTAVRVQEEAINI
jgi:putative redox protein